MDIRNWPMERIMQLPDWCFGRRWLISKNGGATVGVPQYFISQESFAEKGVIWAMFVNTNTTAALNRLNIGLAYADVVPVDNLTFMAKQPVFSGLRETNTMIDICVNGQQTMYWSNIRKSTEPPARKMAICTQSFGGGAVNFVIGLVVSGVPKEVPDWLISGQAASQSQCRTTHIF